MALTLIPPNQARIETFQTDIQPKYDLKDLQFTPLADNKSYFKLLLKNKCLMVVGPAPDLNTTYRYTSNLQAMLHHSTVKNILCLDSSRVYIKKSHAVSLKEHPQILTRGNLLSFYDKNLTEIEASNGYCHINLELADKFELDNAIEKYMPSSVGTRLLKILTNPLFRKFSDAVVKCGISFSSYPAFFNTLSQNLFYIRYDDSRSSHPLKNAYFFPSDAQITTFLDYVFTLTKNNHIPFIHCANSLGRTGYYIAKLIENITSSKFEEAATLIKKQYNKHAYTEIIRYHRIMTEDSSNHCILQ